MIQGDQKGAHECYISNLAMKKGDNTHEASTLTEAHDIDITILDPILGVKNERLTPIKELKEVQIWPLGHKVTRIGTSLSKETECKPVNQLKMNVNLLAWPLSNMPYINTRVVCNCLVVEPTVRLLSQRY